MDPEGPRNESALRLYIRQRNVVARPRRESALLRVASVLTAICALISTPPVEAVGDVGGDGRVTVSDTILALRAATGLLKLSDSAAREADADGNGRITVADALLILRWAAGIGAPPAAPAFWEPVHDDVSSPVYSLIAGPRPENVTAASPGRGLYQSSDSGATWRLVGSRLSAFVDVLMQDPSDPGRILAGSDGDGVLSSPDAGRSWSQVDGVELATVCALAASPAAPRTIYAAGSGIVASYDAGANWVDLDPDPGQVLQVHALAADPRVPGVVILGARTGKILRSQDGGATWVQAQTPTPGRIFWLGFDPFDPHIVYAGTCTARFWRSSDGGSTWVQPPGDTAPPNFNVLLTDANVQGHLIAGTSSGPLESFDSGDTWAPLGSGLEGKEVLSLVRVPGGLLAGMWADEVGIYRLRSMPSR